MQVVSSPANPRRVVLIQQVAGGPASQLAGEGRNAAHAVWSPDGKTIAFSKLGPRYDLFLRHLDGSAAEEPLNVGGLNALVSDWSRDGKWIVFRQDSEKTASDLFLMSMQGDRKPIAFLQTPVREEDARFSPDGRWMAFSREEQGQLEVFVQAISPSGAATGIQYRVSSGGGWEPAWRRDGRELFFRAGKLTAVPILPGAGFQTGPPERLFSVPGSWGVSADGQRFLVVLPVEGSAPSQNLVVVQHWLALIR